MRNDSDAQLVSKIRSGDLAAFEEIIRRHRAVLINTAMHRLGCTDDAEDIAQEAFVQAYFQLHQLREPEALLPWLRRMTDRLALMRLRKKREELLTPEEVEQLKSTSTNVFQNIENGAVDEILQKLPETMRETVALVYIAGYTNAEAANLLGVKEGTIKSRLNRARAILKEAIEMAKREGKSEEEFTKETKERLKREARKLLAEGDFEAVSKKGREILREEFKLFVGDVSKLNTVETLAAYDSHPFQPDQEAIAMIGMPEREQRRKECEANAAQYGFRLEDLDWKLEDVNRWTDYLVLPTGHGQDIWGVPVSRMQLTILDMRSLCQRLRCSPLLLNEWVESGCPILRCRPYARFDLDKVKQWLADKGIREWPFIDAYNLERPIRIIFQEVYEERLSPERADEVMHNLGYGVWEAPLSGMRPKDWDAYVSL